MAKLAANFGGKKDLEARTELYFEKLERFPLEVVQKAVDRTLDETHKYFPLVGHIKAHCVEAEQDLGLVDDSPRAHMRAWEADPYRHVVSGAGSDPCPVCGETLVFSPRGIVIVHNDEKHIEAKISYSNVGRPEWFNMGPPVMPLPPAKPPAAAPIADVLPPASQEAR